MAPKFEQTAIIGAGVIGSSWAALFLATGQSVNIYEPTPNAEKAVRDFVESAWPTLETLGMTKNGNPDRITFYAEARLAVADAQFVQESIPERLDLKHKLFAEIEPHLAPEAIVASSASGFMVREMQQGWQNPSRFLLGHPFNPPHLIPLVELVANERTADGVVEAAESFYQQAGKVTIRIQREVPGHVANRLQAALWREAIHLVESGVASVEDVDKAVWAGPGLRWAAMGPHMLFHLGAGAGGMLEFCNRYSDSFHRWWDDLGEVVITPDVAQKLADGISEESGGEDVTTLAAERDLLIVNMLRYPGAPNWMVWRFISVDAETTYEVFDFFFEQREPSPTQIEALEYIDQVLQKEDIDIVESVQRGMKTPACEQGRFVCDVNGKGESEHAVHHFHSLYLKAIADGGKP